LSADPRLSSARQDSISDAEVFHYETMPLDAVREELRKAGIDPASTIAAVKQLIEDSIANEKGASSPSSPDRRGKRSFRTGS